LGPPLAAHDDGFLGTDFVHGPPKWGCSKRVRGASRAFWILSATSGLEFGSQACCACLRSPGFASPGTFPSQRFSRSQGFAPPNPFAAFFQTAATRRISALEKKEQAIGLSCPGSLPCRGLNQEGTHLLGRGARGGAPVWCTERRKEWGRPHMPRAFRGFRPSPTEVEGEVKRASGIAKTTA
jgi:hypothetical protein